MIGRIAWEAVLLPQVSEASIIGGQPGQHFPGDCGKLQVEAKAILSGLIVGTMITPDHIHN